MSKARLVLTALFVDHQTPAEVAARYGVHRAWVYKLKARYEADGEAAFEPRSRRPKTSPTAVPQATVDLIVELLGELGPDVEIITWLDDCSRYALHVSAHPRVSGPIVLAHESWVRVSPMS